MRLEALQLEGVARRMTVRLGPGEVRCGCLPAAWPVMVCSIGILGVDDQVHVVSPLGRGNTPLDIETGLFFHSTNMGWTLKSHQMWAGAFMDFRAKSPGLDGLLQVF